MKFEEYIKETYLKPLQELMDFLRSLDLTKDQWSDMFKKINEKREKTP